MSKIAKSAAEIDNLDALQAFLGHLKARWGDDPEAAHGIEDALKSRVLELVAEGRSDAPRLARAVLQINDWDVPRWFA